MRKPKDLSGQKFGSLTAIEDTNKKNGGHRIWKCKCDCGKETEVIGKNLINGNSSSCGYCRPDSRKPKDLMGQKFGTLTVIDKAENIDSKTAWLCRCECGKEVAIRTNSLTRKEHNVKSCGCKTKEIISKTHTKDISGHKFGTLAPIKIVGKTKYGHMIWECQCDCGTVKNISISDLKTGNTKSCGHCQRSTLPIDLTGKRYGMLIVMKKADNIGEKTAWQCNCDCGTKDHITKGNNLEMGHAQSCGCQVNYNKYAIESNSKFGRLTILSKFDTEDGHWFYLCKCDCGQEVAINGSHLKFGKSKSCGCLQKELASKRMSLLKGELSYSWKGGGKTDRETTEYREWRKAVLQRDNGICQVCGSVDEIETHHLNAFAKFPEQRYLVTNGVCLCFTCHKLFHIAFGSGDNMESQFNEFKASLGV